MKLGLALDQWDRSQVLPIALERSKHQQQQRVWALAMNASTPSLMCPLRATTTASTMADLTGKVRRF